MNYYNYNQYNQSNPLQPKVKQLQQDKKQLSTAIEELNTCYLQKINLLQNTITQQQVKYEQLLEWKQNHINKSLFEVQRYENQIKKMIEILDMAHHNFQNQKEQLLEQLRQRSTQIKRLKNQNQALHQFNSQTEVKIQDMVKFYNEEIEKLKCQLKEMREESMISEESMIHPLRDISHTVGNENIEPNEKMLDFPLEDMKLMKTVKELCNQ